MDEIVYPGKFVPRILCANNQAVTTAKVGLANSDTCNDNPANFSQRLEPLTSTPKTKVMASPITHNPKANSAKRLICKGVIIDTIMMTVADKGR